MHGSHGRHDAHDTPIALVGFMGAGKSAVGGRVALRLGWPFVDLDEVLVARAGPIALQFARDGEATFRAREAALVRELCDGAPRVLATGGGTFTDPGVRAALRGGYRTAWLDAPLDVLRARVGGGQGRPAWDAAVARRYEERRAAYAEADLRVDAARPVEVVVEEVVAWVRSWSRPDGGRTGS